MRPGLRICGYCDESTYYSQETGACYSLMVLLNPHFIAALIGSPISNQP